jgi:hypothetical protein
VIAAPEIIEQPNLHGAVHDGNNIPPGTWFLSPGHEGTILWINVRGHGEPSEGDPMDHMGRALLNYPSMRCHVYARDSYSEDPVTPNWARLEDLQGTSVFVGINYPFLLGPPDEAGVDGVHAAPVFTPDCVFATHKRFHQVPQPVPDWCRMSVNGGVGIGSTFEYGVANWGDIVESPMWFVPTLPVVVWGFGF